MTLEFIVEPVVRMVSSDFVGTKEDSAAPGRGETGLFPDSCAARRLRNRGWDDGSLATWIDAHFVAVLGC